MSQQEFKAQSKKIRNYLTALAQHLSQLDAQESNEVLREIESHIYDSIDLQEAQGKEVDLDAILERLGAPRQLAQQYVAHVLKGTTPPKGLAKIQAVKRTMNKGLYWGTAALGYSISAALFLIALLKLIFPQDVGLWSNANGNSIVVGFVDKSFQSESELLGIWIIPLAIILAFTIVRLTYGLMSVLKQTKVVSS